MAGFLGFGNYQKPGKGVKKEEREKKRFFQFFDLFFRKFGKLVQLNLLFLLFSLPIVTIGPALAAMTKILRYYTEEKPVFLFSDFINAFKENFMQGFLFSILQGGAIFAIVQAFLFYYVKSFENGFFWIAVVLIFLVGVVSLFASFYTYIMMVSVNLTFWQILKNAYMFAFLGIRTNLLTLLFSTGVLVASLLLIPLSLPVILLLTFSLSSFICVFNTRPYVYRYLMKPYYEMAGIKNPYEPEEETEGTSVFEDDIS